MRVDSEGDPVEITAEVEKAITDLKAEVVEARIFIQKTPDAPKPILDAMKEKLIKGGQELLQKFSNGAKSLTDFFLRRSKT